MVSLIELNVNCLVSIAPALFEATSMNVIAGKTSPKCNCLLVKGTEHSRKRLVKEPLGKVFISIYNVSPKNIFSRNMHSEQKEMSFRISAAST